jgi:fructose-1,6-bisphosphatase/inositol monophosphatase family enzyme
VPDLTFAFRLADAADSVTRLHVGAAAPPVHRKADGSPVTAVDVAVEETLLALVQRQRSRDGFLGEEVGQARDGQRRWIVDGIDGTAAFVAGRLEWATLIGLEVRAAKALHEGYVYPGVGDAMAIDLEAKLKGQYDNAEDESSLAALITSDCRAVSNDRHLDLHVAPAESSAEANHHGPSIDEMRAENYAFRKVEILPGNIGYLKFDAFMDTEEARATGADPRHRCAAASGSGTLSARNPSDPA